MGDVKFGCYDISVREKDLALSQAWHARQRPFFFVHAVVIDIKIYRRFSPTAGHLSFHPMAQCVVHALEGLACRAPVLLAHAEVTKT